MTTVRQISIFASVQQKKSSFYCRPNYFLKFDNKKLNNFKFQISNIKIMATAQNERLNKVETSASNDDNVKEENTSTTQEESPLPPHAFNLNLVDTRTVLIKAWEQELSKLSSKLSEKLSPTDSTKCLKVQIHHEPFQSLLETRKVDCIVSPANSFGLMDGGLDYYLSEYYGGEDELIPVVQKEVEKEWCGEQNVGTCIIVDLRDLIKNLIANPTLKEKNFPSYLAHCPSMRTPKLLDSRDDIVYRCTWAMLTYIRKHNAKVLENSNGKHQRINSVICAGFGTGVGGYPEITCAKQMILAVKNFVEAPANNEVTSDNEGRESAWLIRWSYASRIESSVRSCIS